MGHMLYDIVDFLRCGDDGGMVWENISVLGR